MTRLVPLTLLVLIVTMGTGDSIKAQRQADQSLATPTTTSSPTYPAPEPSGSPLEDTHRIVDSFLAAKDWRGRLPLIYDGANLMPQIDAYYTKHTDPQSSPEATRQIYQYQLDPTLGGPFWIYQIAPKTTDSPLPLIVRVEKGNLKIDWTSYAEFHDNHFIELLCGDRGAGEYRVLASQLEHYSGPDSSAFANRFDYLCYELSIPFGPPGTPAISAFVKKDTHLARTIHRKIPLETEPLACILHLEKIRFPHGVSHFVINKMVTEGWLK